MIHTTPARRSDAPTVQMHVDPIQTGVIEVGTVRVPYRQVGPADAGEAIVFVHGNPGSSEDWSDLLRRVAGIGRAVAIDLPGFGQADKPESFNYTFPGYARFFDQALNTLGISRAHLVVHDIGGYVAGEWASRRLSAVGSLTMINVGVPLGYEWHIGAKMWRTPVLGELIMATTTRPVWGYAIQRGVPRKLPAPFIDRMFREYDKRSRRATLKLYRSIDDPAADAERLAPLLREFKGPVLVVWGARDQFASRDMPNRQTEIFQQAQIEILPDSGHWSFIDDPQRVAELIVPFLWQAVQGRAAD